MFTNLINQTIFQNTVGKYFISITIFLVFIVIIYFLKVCMLNRLKKLVALTKTTIDDFIISHISKTFIPLLLFVSFTVSIKNLVINPGITTIINVISTIFFIGIGVKFVMSLVDYCIDVFCKKTTANDNRMRSLKGIVVAVKIVVIGLALILFLDNMGIKISALVAGLGIGGIAIAFALQAILGDLFSFFVILFDRPFEIGDFIIIDGFMGTIEYIGIKTTRLRSLGGEQLIFSNTALTNARVRNYKRMAQRRVVFKIGVTYQTSLENMKEIPETIKKIISNVSGVRFDRAHFSSYGDFALIYEIVYYALSSDYNKYMDLQQIINFQIKEKFDQLNIDFAYPTQTLFINK